MKETLPVWDLKQIYPTKEKWEEDKKQVKRWIEQIKEYDGKLKEKETILACYDLYRNLIERCDKIYAYSMLQYHLDMANTETMQMYKQAEKLYADFGTAVSFMEPQLMKLEEKQLMQLIQDPTFKEYHKSIQDILENKPYILSEEIEKVLASYQEVFSASENTYNVMTDAELAFSPIQTEKGEEALTQATYSIFMADPKEEIRKQAFQSMYQAYKQYQNTIAELYIARVKQYATTSQLRHYHSSLDRAVHGDDASLKVYEALIQSIHQSILINHEYIRLKGEWIHKEENFHMYDLYVNPFLSKKEEISFKEAKQIVLEALAPMGEDYIQKLQQAFAEGWIDAKTEKTKRSGAYSMNVYDVHPYVLLNYTATNRDVSTIAHELGHAMHSYYASQNQNVLNENYTIMVAEVASTVNEILLSEYRIEQETDREKKKAFLYELTEMIRATFIRQAMFAEFEKEIHEKVERGENLTSKQLNETYYHLNQFYFGDDIQIDEEIQYEWARIPHFYSCFYVYKYATGIAAAIRIATKIRKKEEGYVEKYKDMLKQGRTKKSIDLLKMVDVDLETEDPYKDTFAYYQEKIEELKKLG